MTTQPPGKYSKFAVSLDYSGVKGEIISFLLMFFLGVAIIITIITGFYVTAITAELVTRTISNITC